MTQTVFLSTVSNEFGTLRRRLASLGGRTKKCHIRHQDDFFHRGVKTLQKLVEEIELSTVVLHIIGDQAGWLVPADQANALLDQRPEFEKRFPEVAAQARRGELPATQWEAWLGLLLGKRLLSFQLQTTSPEHLQQLHVQRLNALAEHPQVAENLDALYDEMVGSLITLGILNQADVRPIQLPYQSIGTLFKGRERFLHDLRASLQSHHAATAVTGKAVHGLGGVGKTRLVVEYAWQHAHDYSAVLFLTADSRENLQRTLAELVGPLVLDLAEQAATEEEVRVAAALRWLAEHPGWFLILDNVDTEEAAQHVEELLPKLQKGHVLITSRLSRWQGQVQPLVLDVLAETAAVEFLLQRTEPNGSRGRKVTADDSRDTAALAKDLDGLALALEQAGAYIVARRKSLAEYIELWRGHDARVQQWHNLREMQYPRSVATTWQTTLDHLGADERTLLNVLAWFDAEPVPMSVVSVASVSLCFKDLDENTEDTEDTENGRVWDAERLEAAIANLADFSMLTWDVQAETVKVHRVVQEILRTRQADAKSHLTIALDLLNKATPEGHPSDVRTWPAWEPLRSHVEFAVQAADKLDIPEPTTRLMGAFGALLSAKALHREAEQLERRALAVDERHHGADSTQVAMRLNNLAQTLQATNRLAEAEPLMRRALAIDERSKGADHPHVAIQLNNMALLLQDTNRLAEAEPLLRRALAIDEQSYGDQHPNVAIRLNNLAQLLQATNRLAEAEPLMRRGLAIEETSKGADHPNVAIQLNNLAMLLNATNRLAEAEPLMRRALAIDEQSYGDQHPIVATCLNNLAQLLQATNRLAEAEPLMRRALAIDEQSYGDQHPDVAIDLNNLAVLLKATNRLAEAEPLMRRALAIYEQSLGADHPNVAAALNNLAQTLKATNRLAEAEPLMRRALAIDEQSYGDQHPLVATRLNNLAALLQDTNRLAEAEPLMRRALAIDEQSFGDQHPKVAIRLNNLASLLQATNRLAEAEPLMRRGLAIDEQSYGDQHPNVATDLNNLAALLQATNRLSEAEPLARRAVEIFQKSLGDQHPNTITVRENHAAIVSELEGQ